MRVIFTSWAWPTHFFPLVPLAGAFRLAGHEVLVATQPGLVPTVLASGLPAIAVGTDTDIADVLAAAARRAAAQPGPPLEWEDLRQYRSRTFRAYVGVAEAMVDGLAGVVSGWGADLIVSEPTTYAGALAGALAGVRVVRHTWGVDFAYLQREFEGEALAGLCGRLGLAGVETLGEVSVDPCPPRLQVPVSERVPAAVRRLPMRYVPFNGLGVVPGWLAGLPRRPRVCVTWGTSTQSWDAAAMRAGDVVRALAGLGAELVVAVSGAGAGLLGELPEGVRVAVDVPLSELLPLCDVLVSQGGLGTVMTGVACGLRQVVVPLLADTVLNARRLAESGAGEFVFAEEIAGGGLRAAVERVLGLGCYGEAAGALRDELLALPGPAEIVTTLTST
jgi:UDP:flavonoid glycosyltransferase YjiC (YdhE family)